MCTLSILWNNWDPQDKLSFIFASSIQSMPGLNKTLHCFYQQISWLHNIHCLLNTYYTSRYSDNIVTIPLGVHVYWKKVPMHHTEHPSLRWIFLYTPPSSWYKHHHISSLYLDNASKLWYADYQLILHSLLSLNELNPPNFPTYLELVLLVPPVMLLEAKLQPRSSNWQGLGVWRNFLQRSKLDDIQL